MITRADFAKRLVNAYDLKVSQRRMNALVAWQSAEGTSAKFNPLATTRKMPGSTNFNSVGVQDYTSLASGVEATKLTLDEQHGQNYEPIVKALIDNAAARDILLAVANSAWGTGWLALQVLPYVKANPDRFGSKPIGQ